MVVLSWLFCTCSWTFKNPAGEFLGGLVVKDLPWSLLWLGFSSWPGSFHMPWVRQKKKKKSHWAWGEANRQEICLWRVKNFYISVSGSGNLPSYLWFLLFWKSRNGGRGGSKEASGLVRVGSAVCTTGSLSSGEWLTLSSSWEATAWAARTKNHVKWAQEKAHDAQP